LKLKIFAELSWYPGITRNVSAPALKDVISTNGLMA